MTELEQLKQKYPLALEAINLPVSYDNKTRCIYEFNSGSVKVIAEIENPYGNFKKTTDQIGELIAHLLNQLQ